MGHDLGQHHGHGLQGLDLFLVILTGGAVLHREHAINLPAAHDRHAEEGSVRVFARLRPVGEARMFGGVGQVDRFGAVGDEADQALAPAHARVVDGFAVQAFGGEQLQRIAGAAQIDRADFGDHVGRDDHDELVEARLRARLLRHDFAQAAQQNARDRLPRSPFRPPSPDVRERADHASSSP